jgi:Fic family protein
MAKNNSFSQKFSVFHNRHLPEKESVLAGYSALIQLYELQIPLPEKLSAISKKHQKYEENDWMMLTPRHAPDNSLYGQLVFALKYEGVDLGVLKALFDTINKEIIEEIVRNEPTSAYSRKIWFLYEWLQNQNLDLPNAKKGNIVDILDSELQYPGLSKLSKRHRVNNNLPGTPAFCPIIRKTPKLDHYTNMNLDKKARKVTGKVHQDLLMRAAAYMLLKDSKASFAIERETPSQNRAERWGQAIGEAGRHLLSHDEFIRLQQIIIPDFRFTQLGYRNEDGFVGEHERATGQPIPDHISARWQDVYSLMDGLIATNELLKESEMDAVLAASIIAFGFVFIHPFEDGNGRIHRYLIHHVLSEKKFNPPHIIFPVSSVILDRIDEYRKTLEYYSRPRLEFIKWKPTDKGNVDVLNQTINLYRYFDATKQAEFLYECIYSTIEKTLPEEIEYLQKYDEMKFFIKNYIDMPDRTIDLLIRFLNQENGKLSKRARQKEFSSLTDEEAKTLESKYEDVFHNKEKNFIESDAGLF